MLKELELGHYMVPNPVVVKPNASLFEAMRLIEEGKVSGLCVVDDSGKLVGVLSEMDCLRGILSAVYNDTGIGYVSDFMTADNLIVAHTHESIADIASDMMRIKHRRRPVVDSQGRLVGQITIRQILKAVKGFRDRAA